MTRAKRSRFGLIAKLLLVWLLIEESVSVVLPHTQKGGVNKNTTTTVVTEEVDDDDQALDDRSMLDMFGEKAKEYLTKRVIPPTDAECRWDWTFARCEPACECSLTLLWGDYHLGRSCRLRMQELNDEHAFCTATESSSEKFNLIVGPRRWLVQVVKGLRILRDNCRRAVVRGWNNGIYSKQYQIWQNQICSTVVQTKSRPISKESFCVAPESLTLLEKLVCRQEDWALCAADEKHDNNNPSSPMSLREYYRRRVSSLSILDPEWFQAPDGEWAIARIQTPSVSA